MPGRHGHQFWVVLGGIRDWEEAAERKSGYQITMPLLRHKKNDWSVSSSIRLGHGLGNVLLTLLVILTAAVVPVKWK